MTVALTIMWIFMTESRNTSDGQQIYTMGIGLDRGRHPAQSCLLCAAFGKKWFMNYV